MKRLFYFVLLGIVWGSCSKKEVDPQPACTVTEVNLTLDNSQILFSFNDDGTIKTVTTKGGQDSTVFSYSWNSGKLTGLSIEDSNVGKVDFTPTYDGNELIKLASDVGWEYRFAYAGGRMTTSSQWIRSAAMNYFQFTENKYSYDGSGNLIRSENYLDTLLLDIIYSGQEPTGGFNGTLMQTLEFEYTSNTGANPLRNTWFLEILDMSLLYNWPTKMRFIDPDDPNNPISNDFSITFNEQGYPERMESASMTVVATYNCN